MSDDELRRLLRARDLSPADPVPARRAAALAGRKGERDLAIEGWQEVLRRSPRDDEAERRLVELGCELRYVATDAQGRDEFVSSVDGTVLIRAPVLAGTFVARQPVSYEQFHRFLSREGGGLESGRWISGRGAIRRVSSEVWSLLRREAMAESWIQEVSWLGARAYARWAGGRLLHKSEWECLADAPAALEGFDRVDGEWVDGENEFGKRPYMTLWDTRDGPVAAIEERWAAEDAYPPVLFRYARESWLRGSLSGGRDR